MIHWSLAESAGHFWWPEEFENVANPYFGNLKHLQKQGHLSLTEPSIYMVPHLDKIHGFEKFTQKNKKTLIYLNFNLPLNS